MITWRLARRAAGLLLVAAAWQAHAADGAQDAKPADDKGAKTIELLLRLQGSASAPTRGQRSAELPSIRAGRQADSTADARTPFSDVSHDRPPVAEGEATGATTTEADLENLPAARRRTREAESIVVDRVDVDARDVLPVKILRFLRENREMAIGLALAVLVLAAVAGAAAGAGAKKR